MEIYRRCTNPTRGSLASSLRALATQSIPESATNDELIMTSLLPQGKLLHTWQRLSAAEQRILSREKNDGTQYVEPHLRCHQISVEKWLRGECEAEERVECWWGVRFETVREEEGGVVCEGVRESDGQRVRVRSRWVVGCDGGGSWVRRGVGLESKRNYL
jgi:2-polyprenyl-6-methoxyphenol hydroxylase-like FAD-dependent oxidoreductase